MSKRMDSARLSDLLADKHKRADVDEVVQALKAERERVDELEGLAKFHIEQSALVDGLLSKKLALLGNQLEELQEARDNACNDRDMWRSKHTALVEGLQKLHDEIFTMNIVQIRVQIRVLLGDEDD